MKPVIAVVSQGAMGSGIARRLVDNGVTVRTSLAGRSAGSIARAREAGMQDVPPEALGDCDFFLSVVPPSAAAATARGFAEAIEGRLKKAIFVDCNAVCPATASDIAAIVEGAGGTFVDGSIIGGPPKAGYDGPVLYVSGPQAARLEALRPFRLDIRVLGQSVGEASALKMAYAGITKGLNALGLAMILAASASGSAAALRAEFAESQPELFAWFKRHLPGVFGKAYRWVGEMEEIAAFTAGNKPAADMYSAAAALYESLAAGSEQSANVVRAFLAEPSRAAQRL